MTFFGGKTCKVDSGRLHFTSEIKEYMPNGLIGVVMGINTTTSALLYKHALLSYGTDLSGLFILAQSHSACILARN